MYAAKQFREERRDVLIAAVRSIRFAALVVSGDGGPDAVHLPMVPGHDAGIMVLDGHVASANPFWRTAADGVAALAIFQGPHAYVHPGWYATKRETGKVVPTWNYVAVHVRGRMTAVRDPVWLRSHLEALTDANEAGRAEPWKVADAPADYVDAMLRGIVGLRITVDRIEGVWKMAQHHTDANRQGVIRRLAGYAGMHAAAVAAIMARVRDD